MQLMVTVYSHKKFFKGADQHASMHRRLRFESMYSADLLEGIGAGNQCFLRQTCAHDPVQITYRSGRTDAIEHLERCQVGTREFLRNCPAISRRCAIDRAFGAVLFEIIVAERLRRVTPRRRKRLRASWESDGVRMLGEPDERANRH